KTQWKLFSKSSSNCVQKILKKTKIFSRHFVLINELRQKGMTDQSSISENDTAVASAAVEPWYKKGLNFKCTECGQCCTGGPGFVWVTEEEIAAMADLLQISVKDFKIKYVRKRGKRQSLNERKSDNFACVFLKDKKCLVYKARPEQCRTFPWWKE